MCDRGGGTKWRRGWKAVQNVSFNLFPLLIADSIFSFFCFFLTSSPWGHSPYIVAPHPAMLRDTAGGEVAIWFYCCCFRCFLTPPSFGHLPYILLCTTQGRRIATQSFSLYCFVAPRNAAGHGRGRGCDLILLPSMSLFFNLSVLRTPPLYFAVHNTGEEDCNATLFCSAP